MRKIKGDWWASWRSFVDIRWKNWRPRLVVHEKYEAAVKWILRSLSVLGIGSSLLTLGPTWGVALSIGLLGLEQFLERAVFQYTTIVLTPMPRFDFDLREVTGMVYAWPNVDAPAYLDITGFCFARKELAEQFFDLLLELNYGELEDRDNNIRLTFVWPKDAKGYFVCLCTSPDRKGVKERIEQMSVVGRLALPGKELQPLVVVWGMRRRMGESGQLIHAFLARQRHGHPFWLQVFVSPDGKDPQPIPGKQITKWHYRVAHESELTKRDPEYWVVCR